MPTVHEQLRAAREAAKLSTREAAEAIKLKADQIEALETGNYSVFPAPVYIRGSIRTYAKLLKLDPVSLMTQLDQELSESRELTDPPRLAPLAGGFLDWVTLQLSKLDWRIAAAMATIVLGLIIAWTLIGPAAQPVAKDPLSNLPPGLHSAKSTRLGGGTLPLPTNAPPRQ
ncbi:MAG: helix-turn-helix domain-containing protein [Verrucomicrobia bacterium]|nr:helix-turn-helix domain-containing protein [Verrucomicrobiota bacterium]